MSELAVLNHLFGDSFTHPGFHVTPHNNNNSLQSQSHVRVDFVESEKDYTLHAELAGYKKEDIDVQVDNGVLVLEASKDETKSVGDETSKYYLKERRWGKVHRAFRLPVDADRDAAALTYVDGVLTVTLPKTENKASKKLTIA